MKSAAVTFAPILIVAAGAFFLPAYGKLLAGEPSEVEIALPQPVTEQR